MVFCVGSTIQAQNTNTEQITRLIKACDSLIYDQPQRSLDLAIEAHRLATLINSDSLIATTLNRIGSSHWSLGNQLEAMEKIQASQQMAEANNFESIIAKNLGSIGDVYAASGLVLDAIGYYKSELQVQKSLQDTSRLFTSNNNIGKAYLDLGYIDSAQFYLNTAGNFLDSKFEHQHSIYFINSAELSFYQQNYSETDSLLKLSWNNARNFNSTRGIIRANRLSAELALKMDQPTIAKRHAEEAFNLAQASGAKELIYISSKTLSRCSGALQDFKRAYEMDLLHEQYLDSVQNVTTVNELELLSYYQRLFQVRVLESRNEVNRDTAEQRRLIINGLIIVLVIAALLLTIIIYSSIKIRRQKVELETLNKFKAKIFAIVSHDLKSPIQSVSSVIEMFNQKLIGKEEIEPYLPEVKEKTSNLMNLLNNVFLWAEGQIEGENLKKEDFSLHPVMQDLEKELEERLQEKEIQLKFDSSFGFYLHSNKEVIRIVIRNLVVNAMKFSQPKSKVEVNCVAGEKTKIIEVIDKGIGMSRETRENLFTGDLESMEGTIGEKGNGLGLALCNDFVLGLGGKIEIESVIGEGSVFRVVLPNQPE